MKDKSISKHYKIEVCKGTIMKQQSVKERLWNGSL